MLLPLKVVIKDIESSIHGLEVDNDVGRKEKERFKGSKGRISLFLRLAMVSKCLCMYVCMGKM